MGTRSNIKVYNTSNEVILSLFGMYDGQVAYGVGEDLYEFASKFKVTNGLPLGDCDGLANGVECFALQLVCHLKKRPGNWYAEPFDSENEKHHYTIYENDGAIKVYALIDGEEQLIDDDFINSLKGEH